MTSSENMFTHDEIWDDSALVNAWDEALQEYKVSAGLHGIAALEARRLAKPNDQKVLLTNMANNAY